MTRIATLLKPVPVATTAVVAATGAWLAWTPVADAQTEAPDAPDAVADLVDRVGPAVVTVLATHEGRDGVEGMPGGSPFGPGSPFEEFFRQFGMPTPQVPPQPDGRPDGTGIGSGFVIDDEGYIVTNNHVVADADEVQIRLWDNRELEAEVVGTDPQTDLALLKVEGAGDLVELPFGDSDQVRVGADVIAVGNPFGLGGTVTRGIVSALARDIDAGPYVDFIQTDAAINRGNSGGPLLNMDGEVIGVNSAIYSPTGGSVGVGFAIPSSTVEMVVAELRDDGEVERGWLGVTIQNVTPEIAAAIGLDEPHGALVADVAEDSPSDGKLETGDVILSFDGSRVESSRELPQLVAAADPESRVEVEVLRQGERQTVELQLGRLDAERMAALEPGDRGEAEGLASDRLGATLAPITPAVRDQLELDENVEGVVITSLDGDGLAAESGLQVGDVILQVGGTAVESPRDVTEAIGAAKTDAVLMQIEREGARIFVGVRLA
jgi:serine protease Do